MAAAPAQPLDQRGTRRAARVKIAGKVECSSTATQQRSSNLSIVGAQVVSPTILKPNQRVRIALPDDPGTMRFNAQVAWASFEIPAKSGPHDRAGIDFVDADAHCSTRSARTTRRRSRPSPARRERQVRLPTGGRSQDGVVASEPVETIAARTPDTASSRAM